MRDGPGEDDAAGLVLAQVGKVAGVDEIFPPEMMLPANTSLTRMSARSPGLGSEVLSFSIAFGPSRLPRMTGFSELGGTENDTGTVSFSSVMDEGTTV